MNHISPNNQSNYPLFDYLKNKVSDCINNISDDQLIEKINKCDEVKMMNIYTIIKLYQIYNENNIFNEPYSAIYIKQQDNCKVSFKINVLPEELKKMIYIYVDEK